jgi:hypothetical protein
MGQKATKPGATGVGAPKAEASAQKAPSDLATALANDNTATKAWAKSVSVDAYSAVLLFEGIEKRRAVYTSGKRCGDSEEALKEKISNLGIALVEKHLAEDAEQPLRLGVAIPDNVEELAAFDAVQAAAKSFVEQLAK